MIPNMGLSEARMRTVEPDGYIVRVQGVEIDMKYNRLRLQIDIVEGPNAGYYSRLYNQQQFWGLYSNLSLDQKDAWKFANAVDAFRASNENFQWDDDGENDEHKMVGMYVGAITRRNHYIGNDGTEKTKLQVHHLVPVGDIRSGNFEIPEDSYAKELQERVQAPAPGGVVDTTAAPAAPEPARQDPPMINGFQNLSDDDVPF